MAGVHGDEVEGVYLLSKIFEWLKEGDNNFDIPMIIIPILNIDGYRNSRRVNSHGVDLNRNLPTENWTKEFKDPNNNPGEEPLSEVENKFLVKLMNKYPPGLILTYHSWKPILNYNGDCKDVADFLHEHNNYPVADDIGYPTPGSLGTYGPKEFNAPVLTFECPVLKECKELSQVWDENQEGIKQLFEKKVLERFISLN